jgi:hypothetical protein
MNTHAALAIVKALLTPNLRGALPFVVMLLMIQDIHPEIIFELISHVQISQLQYNTIIMACTQLRLFASLLPAVKGVKPTTFRDQRSRFRILLQNKVSMIFGKFQNSVLSRILVQCEFARTLPSFDVVNNLVSNLAIVRMSTCLIFPIDNLLLSPNANLLLLETGLKMKIMIEHFRVSYPEIVSILAQNKNAQMNLIIVWMKQVIVKKNLYLKLIDIHEPLKIHIMFVICILAVIDKRFIDKRLVQFIQSCGDLNDQKPFLQEHLEFLKDFEKIDPMILQVLNIERVIELFSSMCTSTNRFNVRYALEQWSMAFGQIVYSGQHRFEEIEIKEDSLTPIFDVFTRFWEVFFRNFARTFEVSFLPFGNIPWSEGYTCLCTRNFIKIIQIAVENFALRIGAEDDHAFIRKKICWMKNYVISGSSYRVLIFPEGIENFSIFSISREICSCFLRDFWRAHRKPDPTMSDIDYIRWLFLIPAYAVFGKSWIELVDALQNGTEFPRVQGSRFIGDSRYLSCPTRETDPNVQKEYDEYFKKGNRRRKLQISDYS